ncbi:MAG: hypothetical protein LQ347_005579 [Umbilicaria vellea]|nr:MAG: hypothetical protein LQ347_005579 [Umbilicaria vellea]
MSPSCFGTYSPGFTSRPQVQYSTLHPKALSAQSCPVSQAETEDELLVLKRVDLTIAPYFHAFPPYPGQWDQRQCSKPSLTEAMASLPLDVTAYTTWVIEGFSSFIQDFEHDTTEMANLIAEIRAGPIDPAVPNIPVPMFSQPSRTGDIGASFAGLVTKRHSGQAQAINSRLQFNKFLEACIQVYQIHREALWLELFGLFPDTISVDPTPQALQGPPIRGTQSIRGIRVRLHKKGLSHAPDPLSVIRHDLPEAGVVYRLPFRNERYQPDVAIHWSSDTLPHRSKQWVCPTTNTSFVAGNSESGH